MYLMSKIEDTVRVPPALFEEPLDDVAFELLNENYVGKIDKKMGIMVTVKEVENIGVGRVIMGDGAAYHDVTFTALFFKPELQEVIEGEVIEIQNLEHLSEWDQWMVWFTFPKLLMII